MDIFLSLVQLLQQTNTVQSSDQLSKGIDKATPEFATSQQTSMPIPVSLADRLQWRENSSVCELPSMGHKLTKWPVVKPSLTNGFEDFPPYSASEERHSSGKTSHLRSYLKEYSWKRSPKLCSQHSSVFLKENVSAEMFDPRKGSEANGRPISGSSEMGESQSADGCAYKFA